MSEQLKLTDEGRLHVLPMMRELRTSLGRDMTADELRAWLNGWLCAEKYAAQCAITGAEFRWLNQMVVSLEDSERTWTLKYGERTLKLSDEEYATLRDAADSGNLSELFRLADEYASREES